MKPFDIKINHFDDCNLSQWLFFLSKLESGDSHSPLNKKN